MQKLEGLPKLQPGYFWRIKSQFDTRNYMTLQLRKKLWWIFSSKAGSQWFRIYDDPTQTAECLERAAKHIVKEHNERMKQTDNRSGLKGDWYS